MNRFHTNNMKSKKINWSILICLGVFFLISILSIYATNLFLKPELKNLYLKQILFYLIGFLILIFTTYKGFSWFKKYHFLIYIGINILLLALLFLGININGSKCWFLIGPISFQPSELMKISLIITLSKILIKFQKQKDNHFSKELFLLLKMFLITIIPSILTFLEPDTGAVIIYLLILLIFLINSHINKKWYLFLTINIVIFLSLILGLYFFKQDLFFKLIGENIFYRMERILNWSKESGFQLENSLIAIGASGLLGFGYLKNPLYFPEPQTDFIFTTYTANFGFLGAILLILTILIFDTKILNLCLKKIKTEDKYILLGIFIMIFYGQIQNIAMTLGLLPITGIPLPFISYGGSSLLAYLFILGIVLNIERELYKYRN